MARGRTKQLCKAFTCCTHEVHAYVVYYWGRCSKPVGGYGGQCMGMQGCEGEDGRVMSAHEAGRGVHDGHAAGAWRRHVTGVCVYVGGMVALM